MPVEGVCLGIVENDTGTADIQNKYNITKQKIIFIRFSVVGP